MSVTGGPSEATGDWRASWCQTNFAIMLSMACVDVLAFLGMPHTTFPQTDGKVLVASIFEWSGYIGLIFLIVSIIFLGLPRAPLGLRVCNLLLSIFLSAAGLLAPAIA